MGGGQPHSHDHGLRSVGAQRQVTQRGVREVSVPCVDRRNLAGELGVGGTPVERSCQQRARLASGSLCAGLPLTYDSTEWNESIAEVVEQAEQIQAAADACPKRWAIESGPADRALLDLYCLLALRSGCMVLHLDVRRAALATGFGRSTVHRANGRLSLDCWLAVRGGDGPAGTHEVLAVTEEHPAVRSDWSARGGAQGTPPPVEERREALVEGLAARLAAGRADVFAHGRAVGSCGGGLGHHAGRIYQQLREGTGGSLSVAELSEVTGYRSRTVTRHLERMNDLMVVGRAVMVVHHECRTCGVMPGQSCVTGTVRRHHVARRKLARARSGGGGGYCRIREGALVQGAQVLGSYGRLAARARQYAVEVELWRWWQEEVAWMRSPKAGVRNGPRVHEDQAVLVVSTLRGDHAVARLRVGRRIVTA